MDTEAASFNEKNKDEEETGVVEGYMWDEIEIKVIELSMPFSDMPKDTCSNSSGSSLPSLDSLEELSTDNTDLCTNSSNSTGSFVPSLDSLGQLSRDNMDQDIQRIKTNERINTWLHGLDVCNEKN